MGKKLRRIIVQNRDIRAVILCFMKIHVILLNSFVMFIRIFNFCFEMAIPSNYFVLYYEQRLRFVLFTVSSLMAYTRLAI